VQRVPRIARRGAQLARQIGPRGLTQREQDQPRGPSAQAVESRGLRRVPADLMEQRVLQEVGARKRRKTGGLIPRRTPPDEFLAWAQHEADG